jgi:transcriptional regulator with XRE-family HTH domain
MPNTRNGLSEFVRRIMKLKGLTQKDIERMSGGRITDGYVASITTERATNLSVDKLVALADGLGVDPDELFRVARGLAEGEHDRTHTGEALMILEIVQKAVASPDVTEILNEAVRMSPEERALLLRSMQRVAESKLKAGRKTERARTQEPRGSSRS